MALGQYTAVVGPARSGTTWLFKYLQERSTIGTGWIKELDWFTQAFNHLTDFASNKHARIAAQQQRKAESLGRPLRPWEVARQERAELKTTADFRAFLGRWNMPGQPVVDITPAYGGLGADAFRDMRAHFPGARALVLLRNPTDRAWSCAAHHRRLTDPTAQMEDCLQYRLDALDSHKDAFNARLDQVPSLYMTLLEVFPPEDILCVYTEDLFGPDRQWVLDSILAFMGGRHRFSRDFQYTENMGFYPAMPDAIRREMVRRYAPTYAFARALMGRWPEAWQADWDTYMSPEMTRTYQL